MTQNACCSYLRRVKHFVSISSSMSITRNPEAFYSRDKSMNVLLNLLEPHKPAALTFEVVEKRR